jgi:hypothetical protein
MKKFKHPPLWNGTEKYDADITVKDIHYLFTEFSKNLPTGSKATGWIQTDRKNRELLSINFLFKKKDLNVPHGVIYL